MTKPSEFDLIARYFAPLTVSEPGAMALCDDAAVLQLEPGTRLVITTDALVAGVHFPADAAPEDIATKMLRVNVSDLASMGAKPRAFTIAAALTNTIDEDWIARFSKTIEHDQNALGLTLVGGDTVATPGPLTLSVTAFGTVPASAALHRSGAQAGDAIWVSGTIGDAYLGLQSIFGTDFGLSQEDKAFLFRRYHKPEPRIALGMALLQVATAAADVSDGLIADLRHICEASGLSATLSGDPAPLSPAARQALENRSQLAIDALLSGGDDYELVFTAPQSKENEVLQAAKSAQTPITRIGVMTTGEKGVISDREGRPLDKTVGGYRHF